MITLKTLKWSNCFSYGPNNELELDSTNLTQIVGTNGMGKSSIPLIIEEALFNKNSKNIKKADIPNRYVNKGYDIYLAFSSEGKLYEVSITRRSTLKICLLEDGTDISSHTATDTYKTIQEIVGTEYKTFSQLVYQNTNSGLQFLTATDTVRKKFLIDLLNLEEYVSLFEVFKAAAKESSSNLTAINSQVSTIEKWLKDNNLTDTTILPLLENTINSEEDEKLFQQWTAELKNISEKNKKIVQNNKYKEMLSGIKIDEVHGIEANKLLSYDDLQEEGGRLSSAIISAKAMLKKLEGLGDHCPTCEQSINPVFKQGLIDTEKERAETALRELEDEIKPAIQSIKENNRLYQRKCTLEKEWADIYKSIDRTLEESTVDAVELASRIEGVRRRISDEKAKLEAISRENQERTRRNTRIQVIQEQTDKFLEELSTATENLVKEQELNSRLEVLKKSFSTNGLLAYKIENLVKELEELVNLYLAELSDGRFTLEFVVSNDKLNVSITDGGTPIDILALSSGELARVNTATLLAIRKLMSSISKSKINILFLDEVINVLDDVGREKLVEVLLGEEELNTYIVSHGWTHPLLNKVEVVKRGNISALEK
jgi:DNA repair exonuclease SbcCD ATPase subunit